MKDPKRAEAIIRAVIDNTDLPVTVKFRSGWNESSITAPEFATMAENAGAAAVTVHARTWTQLFGGQADWEVIAKVKKSVSIPVIGNGDILCHADYRVSNDGRNRLRWSYGGSGCFGQPLGFSTGQHAGGY